MHNKLDIRKGPPGQEQRVFLEGRLDAGWAGHLDDYLNSLVREGSRLLILNMAGVQYLSSAGIRILVSQYKKITRIGGLFILEELSQQAEEVLKMTGMIGILTEGAPEIPSPGETRPEYIELEGYRFDNNVLAKEIMHLGMIGDPGRLPASSYGDTDNRTIRFTSNQYGLGIGAIGSGFDDCRSRYGEFLALGDALVYKPSDGSKIPDFTVRAGQLEPEIQALYALSAEGSFSHQVLFEPMESGRFITLGSLASALEQIAGTNRFAFMLIAESGGLVGVSLNAPPVEGKPLFEFPGIRDNIHFTTEPAHSRMLSVVFGFYATDPEEPFRSFLRPVEPGSTAFLHAHAAVFPFQALPKKERSAGKLVLHLFETSMVTDLLHLVHDSREIAGLGQSTFRQGVAWIGKLNKPL